MRKVTFHIANKAANITESSSGKVDRYEYLTDEEMLPSNQGRITESITFT